MSSTSIEVLDERIRNIDKMVSEIKESILDHIRTDGVRLTRVESWMWKVIGALVIMNIFFVPVGVYLLIKLVEVGFNRR